MAVTRFVVEERDVIADGASWGKAGAYERLAGTAHFAVDPHDPRNAVIFNIDKSPRNDAGLVEFSTQFVILKPVDLEKSNAKIWYGLNNRGVSHEIVNHALPLASSNWISSLSAKDIGESNILLQDGYIFVDAGWHGDGILDPNKLFANLPVATQSDGSPITGPVRLQYTVQELTFTQPLAIWAGAYIWAPYEPVEEAMAEAVLTVRDRQGAPALPLSHDEWAFGQCDANGKSLLKGNSHICLFKGLQPGKVYELTYQAKNPIVMGLAYAITRDIASFLRFATVDEAGVRNPVAMCSEETGIKRCYLSGTSSTGTYLRDFLYLGFNEDEQGRRVSDAVSIYSAGAHRLQANTQFVHPTIWSGQDHTQDYTATAMAPFTYAVTTDPLSGVTDGILKRPETDPLVIQVDEECAFWQWRACLNVVDSNGETLPLPENVRLYFLPGWGHIGAAGLLAPPEPPGICQVATQGGASQPLIARAIVRILDAWADRGVAPPPNSYPAASDLVSLQQFGELFPTIPQIKPPEVLNELTVYDFGPFFNARGGAQTIVPPARKAAYRIKVPKPTAEGWAVGGVQTIYTLVPLGTNVGWNVRSGERAPDLGRLAGSYVPFAAKKEERLANSDPRFSLEERYGDAAGFVQKVAQATDRLVEERFLLEEDGAALVEAAGAMVPDF